MAVEQKSKAELAILLPQPYPVFLILSSLLQNCEILLSRPSRFFRQSLHINKVCISRPVNV